MVPATASRAMPETSSAIPEARDNLLILQDFFAAAADGRLLSAGPEAARARRDAAIAALEGLLTWQRPALAAGPGLAWPYRELVRLEACLRAAADSSEPNTRRQAELTLARLPVPGQWRRLANLAPDLAADPEICDFLAAETQTGRAKLAAKPQSYYRIGHFCQVLKAPGNDGEKGLLRLFSLHYALADDSLLADLARDWALFVEPTMGLIYRHAWLRAFDRPETIVLFGLGGAEDRAFLAGQGLSATPLAHGSFLPEEPAPVVRTKDAGIVFNATFDEMERKRHGLLLALLKAPELATVTALVLGRGSAAGVDRFTDMIRAAGLQGRVSVAANLRREEVPAFLARARVGVHLSLYENGPRAIPEFWRADLPVVVSRAMAGQDFSLFCPENGLAVDDAELARSISSVLAAPGRFAPRRWFLAQAGSRNGTRALNATFKALYAARGWPWTADIAPLASGGAGRAADPEDFERFRPQYEALAEAFARHPHLPVRPLLEKSGTPSGDASLRAELAAILAAVGPENIWRPVLDERGRRLAEGIGLPDDGLPADLAGLDFAGKSVADLGANFGYYTFLAARLGAHLAVGVEQHPEVVRGARLLARLLRVDNARFVRSDFLAEPPAEACDTAMMIDIIGKRIIAKGKLAAVLDAARAWGRRELVFTFRPIYALKDLGLTAARLKQLYPTARITDGRFLLLDFVRDFYGPDWRLDILTKAPDLARKMKYLLRFTRRDQAAE